MEFVWPTREVARAIVFLHQRSELVIQCAMNSLLDRRLAPVLQHLRPHQQRCARRTELRSARRGANELRALDELVRHVLAGGYPFLEAASPCRKSIRPGFHGERPAADAIDMKGPVPTVSVEIVG